MLVGPIASKQHLLISIFCALTKHQCCAGTLLLISEIYRPIPGLLEYLSVCFLFIFFFHQNVKAFRAGIMSVLEDVSDFVNVFMI